MIRFLAAEPPGSHNLTEVCGNGYWNLVALKFYYCGFSADALFSSAVAILATLLILFLVARRVSTGVPGKLQMVLEFLLDYARGMVKESVAEDAMFILPIAATVALYILIANWIDFFPSPSHLFFPANADLNQTMAMSMVVILIVQWYSIRVQGLGGYLRRFTKPFELPLLVRIFFIPLNIIEEIVKPITLALRLFGNIFAGLLMVYLLTLLPIFISPVLVSAWKFFDVFFVGTIQAFIFMLLTIIYFGMAREGLEEHGHGHGSPAAAREPGATATTSTPAH